MEASSDLWKVESVFYPPAIRVTASASSETMSVPQEAEAAQIIVTLGESTEGGEPYDTTEAPGGLNPEMPKEAVKSMVSAQICSAEELASHLCSAPTGHSPYWSPRALRLILLSLPKKGMSPRAPRLVLLGLPKMWPKRNRRSRSLGQLLYLFLV